ncbi:Centromere protein U [Camelus dromedarius]|uniref:Centromere protein U n=1 Tax=Camelus dromedarius TaxID=9838 RepID=A0A5N4CFJ7_CAMDR|nr:Centromere protein U [Camelus dromedarius]
MVLCCEDSAMSIEDKILALEQPPLQQRDGQETRKKSAVAVVWDIRDKDDSRKAGQKHKPTDVFDFPDDSDTSSIGRPGENEKDEEPYETFEERAELDFTPKWFDTGGVGLWARVEEKELAKEGEDQWLEGKEGNQKRDQRSSGTSETEASQNESVRISAKKTVIYRRRVICWDNAVFLTQPRRKLRPISDESESTEEGDVRRKVKPAGKVSSQRREAASATAASELSEKPAGSVIPKKTGPLGAESSVEKETLAAASQPKTQEKKMFHGKRKKPRSEATDLGTE